MPDGMRTSGIRHSLHTDSKGWRLGVAAALGAMAAAAMPPVYAVPLLVVSFAGLVWLIHASASPWRAAVLGWGFGMAHFIVSIYWIAPVLLRFSGSSYKAVVGLLGLSAYLALFPALAAFAARLGSLTVAGRVLAVTIAWSAAEWLRGYVFGGYPINPMGMVWMPSLAMVQFTSLAGVYGLGFVTVLAAAAPATLFPWRGRSLGAPAWALPVLAVTLLAVIWAGGMVRLALAPDSPPTGLSLRLVQTGMQQRTEWPDERRMGVVEEHLRLSSQPGFEDTDLVIWPETAVNFYLEEDASLRARVARAAPPKGYLLTGALRRTQEEGRIKAIWNSFHALTPEGDIVATYDKHHLVPFGEFMPLHELHPFRVLPYEAMFYSAGPGPRTLQLPQVPPFSPMICYEAIFPGKVVAGGARPQWLLNISNDAWFKGTSGTEQHLEASRMRAVEEGLPLVRATNTGITAIIDAWGRTRQQLDYGEAGVLDARLPAAPGALTLQARWGDWTLAVLLLLAGAVLGMVGRTRKMPTDHQQGRQ